MSICTIQLPVWLSAGMVFQQGVSLLLEGSAMCHVPVKLEVVKDPTDGRKVSKLDTDYGIIWSHETRSDDEGRFTFELPSYKPSNDAYTFVFTVPGETISVKDLRCGDLWLMIGSNPLATPVSRTGAPRTPLKDSALRLVRFFTSPRSGIKQGDDYLPQPSPDIPDAHWINVRAGKALGAVSSTAFSMAYHLADQLHYPVGVIDLAISDSSVFSWISRSTILGDDSLCEYLKKNHLFLPEEGWDMQKEKAANLEPAPLPSNTTAVKPTSSAYRVQEEFLLKTGKIPSEFTKITPEKGIQVREIPGPMRMTALYNHKIFPLRHMNIRGIVFAPDISDTEHTEEYEAALRALLTDLSQVFGPKKITARQHIPSLILIQLKPTIPESSDPYQLVNFNENLCAIRRKLPMPIGILGQHDMLLPDKSFPFYIGRRLSSIALGLHFTPKMPTSSPECVGVEIVGNKILISFDNTCDGLRLAENESVLRGFAVCGEDKVYRPASAKILHGVRVMVWHDDIPEPRGVTYGYKPIPHDATFKTRADLPVLPFRFDRADATYSPDLTFTSCDQLTFIGMDKDSDDYALLPIYRVVKGDGRIYSEQLNKTEGSAALRIEYVPEDGEFSFGPILEYPSLLSPIRLESFRSVRIDIFNPDLGEKKLTVSGFSGAATIEKGLKWQTVSLSYPKDSKMILKDFVITISDSQCKGSVYVDNIRFMP